VHCKSAVYAHVDGGLSYAILQGDSTVGWLLLLQGDSTVGWLFAIEAPLMWHQLLRDSVFNEFVIGRWHELRRELWSVCV
jgi:hypothetical protein